MAAIAVETAGTDVHFSPRFGKSQELVMAQFEVRVWTPRKLDVTTQLRHNKPNDDPTVPQPSTSMANHHFPLSPIKPPLLP